MMPRDPEPAPELVTARVRGGRSPWLVAVVSLIVLGSVVYVGVSGHDNAPAHSSNPASSLAVAALAGSPAPSASPSPVPLPAEPAPAAQPVSPAVYPGATAIPAAAAGGTPPARYLATGLELAGQVTLAVLAYQGSGELHAAYRVPLPAPVGAATLQFLDVDGQGGLIPYGSWNVPIGVFHGGVNQDSVIGAYGPTVLLTQNRPPDLMPDPQEARISSNGFNIMVTGQQDGQYEIVNIDLALRSDPLFPDEQYQVVAKAGSKSYLGVTQHSLPGHFQGEIPLSPLLSASRVVVELRATPGGADRSVPVVKHQFAGPGTPAYATDERTVVISGSPSQPGGALNIMSVGYTVTLMMTFDGPDFVVFYDVRINPTPDTAVHHWVTGDDGLVGWPSTDASASQQ